mmetsp:Transcript_9011/g.16892  ORF Transcript_9011/g.16892 Transcript_9011/m.16892 type:complete len:346 (+) Transcript_9011:1100-2137(+)
MLGLAGVEIDFEEKNQQAQTQRLIDSTNTKSKVSPTMEVGPVKADPAMSFDASEDKMAAPSASGMDRNGSGIIGNATAEDIEWVKKKVGNDAGEILAVFAPGPEISSRVAYMQFKTLAMLPCFWPHMIMCCPCLWLSAANNERFLQNTLYVVGSEGIFTVVKDHTPVCCGCISTGNDYTFLPWDQVVTVNVDNQGQGCQWAKMPRVFIQTHGVVSRGENGVAMNGCSWYLVDCDSVATLIRSKLREEKNALKPSPSGGAAVAHPVSVAQPETFRVFLVDSSNPDKKKVYKVSKEGSWDEFKSGVVATLGIKCENPSLYLMHGDSKVELDDIESIDANDTVYVDPA